MLNVIVMNMKRPVIFAASIIAIAMLSSTSRLNSVSKLISASRLDSVPRFDSVPKLDSVSRLENATIKGFISPSEGALEVWAVSPDETIKADVANGRFELNGVKEGTYDIRVQTIPTYKCVTKEEIKVEDGAQVNLGEIKLEKADGFLLKCMAHGR